MKLKQILFLFIFAISFIKPTLATVKNKKTTITKQKKLMRSTHAKKHGSGKLKKHQKFAKKSDYMHGTASYYGKGDSFNGKLMADGEVFDTYNMFVAAHPTLPLGTKLKVIDNYNGRTAYVEVKDRMPRGRRVIDLSYAAAKHLRMQKRGLSNVTLVRIDDAEFYKQKHRLEYLELSNLNSSSSN